MRFAVKFALVAAGLINIGMAQTRSESGWFPSVPQPVPAESSATTTTVPRTQSSERFNQPGFVRPTQHATPLTPTSAVPTNPTPAIESPTRREITAEDYQRNFQPSYVPPMAVETQVRGGNESEEVPSTWVGEVRSTEVPPVDVNRSAETDRLEPSIYEPAAVTPEPKPVPVPVVVQPPPVLPTNIPQPVEGPVAESRGMIEPRSTLPTTPRSMETHVPSVEPKKSGRELSITTLLLFGSLGLNIYLIWISMDTYYRYQDLVNEMRSTRSRRQRRGSTRHTDDVMEPATY